MRRFVVYTDASLQREDVHGLKAQGTILVLSPRKTYREFITVVAQLADDGHGAYDRLVTRLEMEAIFKALNKFGHKPNLVIYTDSKNAQRTIQDERVIWIPRSSNRAGWELEKDNKLRHIKLKQNVNRAFSNI